MSFLDPNIVDYVIDRVCFPTLNEGHCQQLLANVLAFCISA